MRYLTVTICLAVITSLSAVAQPELLTAAERSGFKSTSAYDDVMTFVEKLRKSSSLVRVETIATSVEGRQIPLLVIGNPLPRSPEDLRNDRRIVVYVQANIHAGEVEGKEACLMFARDILKDKKPALLNNVVLLICPNLNPDGNEQISPENRTYQNGPVNGVGVRHNGQFLDLNRDGMKAESPEIRGVLRNVFGRWDPSVFMDCHTTNGSYHVEPVTFTWMVNPSGDRSLINYMRDRMAPEISATLLDRYKVENCFYGEFFDMLHPEKGWVLDASEPRYITNYYGIRNRLGILNENYVYADYKSRVYGCYYLLHSLADYASLHKDEIRNMLEEADNRTIRRGMDPSIADSFPVSYKVRPAPEKVLVKTYEVEAAGESGSWRNYRKTDRQVNVTVPYYIDYYPEKSVKFPFAYLLTVKDPRILDLLKLHGIKVEKLTKKLNVGVENFELTGLKAAPRLNQGHYNNTAKGEYRTKTMEFPEGTIVVRTSQPLANVAAYLLEPQTNDGLVSWNFFDSYLVPQWSGGFNPYPVYRVMNKTEIVSTIAD